jgi:hypothetical protein
MNLYYKSKTCICRLTSQFSASSTKAKVSVFVIEFMSGKIKIKIKIITPRQCGWLDPARTG